MRQIFLVLFFSIFAGLVSCHNMEEPREIVKMGGRIDEDELKAIHILYDSLKLENEKRYDNWVKKSYDNYTPLNPEYYSPYVDPFILNRYGLVFELDSVSNCSVVTKMSLNHLPYSEEICLPDIFDKFKHLKDFSISITSNAKLTLPPSLFDCPLERLQIYGRLSGALPSNFGNLANTLQILAINSHYGNDLLNLISDFTILKEADLMNNDFTGKTPYYPHSKIYYDFRGNNFTEFDWRYLEDYATFYEAYQNHLKGANREFYIPCFQRNMINDSLPPYFNEIFPISYFKNDLDSFMGYIFGYNPIYNTYDALRFKYWGWYDTFYIYEP